jgi:hypothetical protein
VPVKPSNKIIKKIEHFIYQEQMFSVYQASKILTHLGITYEDLYEKGEPALLARLNYKETTPVFSYYIIKNILMFHIDEFMKWCYINNHSSLDFHKNNIDVTINHFINFIREHHDNRLLVLSMDQVRNWFLKQENNQRVDKIPIMTLRMSLIE